MKIEDFAENGFASVPVAKQDIFRQHWESKQNRNSRIAQEKQERLQASAGIKQPTLIRKAASATVAIVKHAASGFQAASDEMQAERLLICEECPLLDRKRNVCISCGCPIKKKTRMQSQKCPKGKW